MNTLSHSEQALKKLFNSTTDKSAFSQAQEEIAEVIASYEHLDAKIPQRSQGKYKDIIINDTISIKDFCKQFFGTSVFFYPDNDFGYTLWGLAQKRIFHPMNEGFGFYLCLFHEMMHAIYHRHQSAILAKHKYDRLGELQRERHTREKALEGLAIFEKEYGISLLGEFTSKKEVYQFIDTFLATYMPYKLAHTTQDIFFTLQQNTEN